MSASRITKKELLALLSRLIAALEVPSELCQRELDYLIMDAEAAWKELDEEEAK